MTSMPKIEQISLNEVIIWCPLDTAFPYISEAIRRLGKIKQEDRSKQFIVGRIKRGLQFIKVRASLVEREQDKTTVVIQASSDDVFGLGEKSVKKRFIETLRNLDNPGYEPDRFGIHPSLLFGWIIGLIILLFVIITCVLDKLTKSPPHTNYIQTNLDAYDVRTHPTGLSGPDFEIFWFPRSSEGIHTAHRTEAQRSVAPAARIKITRR